MIDAKTYKGTTKFYFNGDAPELVSDILMIIQSICEEVATKNPEEAAFIVKFIAAELKSPEFLKELDNHETD